MTTTVNLGIGLARQGKMVLHIDADSQGNLTYSLGWNEPDKLNCIPHYYLVKMIMDIVVDAHLWIAATTLDGILVIKDHGRIEFCKESKRIYIS